MQTISIGRDAKNQIVLNDSFVSRHHAQLVVLDDGRIMLKDLGSANGSFVNGKKVSEAVLNPGDVVKCGGAFINWSQYANNSGSSFVHYNPNEEKIDLSSVTAKAAEWNNKFLSFINPFLTTIDSGSFFRKVFGALYTIIAVVNILAPVYVLFKAIDYGIFDAEGRFVFTFLILWFAVALLCWFGFQLWWNRRAKVQQSSYAGAEFVAIPVLAHFIQTIGEWYGIIVGTLGILIGMLSLLFSVEQNSIYYYVIRLLELPLGTGWQMIFLGPITGFFIIIGFRFVSELIKAFAVIANNTKKTSDG